MIEKFQASFLGFAIGDALGAPLEDVLPDSPYKENPVTDYCKAYPSHPVSHLNPGQYSDETQAMLAVAESMIESGGFSIDNLVQKFVDWYQSQKLRSVWRFPSNTMMKACRKLAAGTSWTQSGLPSAGSIAVVRTLPLALSLWRTPALLRDAIEKSVRATHTDQRVLAGAMILATAIKVGLEGGDPSFENFQNLAIERAQMYSPDVQKRMKTLRDSLRMDPQLAMEQIGCGGMAMEAVPAALFWFFRNPKRFDDMIIGAANTGGDSDAVAAMAGAVFGAFNGLLAIPERWLKRLENIAEIKQTASNLYRVSVSAK